MAYNFETRLVYSFDIYPRAYFDTNFTNVTVLGTVGFEIASRYVDIHALHAQVYPTLPAGTPNDPGAYNYLLLKTANNSTTVIGIPWIKENTIELIESRTMLVTIDSISASDVSKVRNALVQNGYRNIDIKMVS